jgi:hypothetical protein
MENDIKIDIKEMGCECVDYLAQDRGQLRIVNTVLYSASTGSG